MSYGGKVYRGQRYPSDWRRRRAVVLARDGHVCWICGGEGADCVDHVVPIVRGGSHDYGNLRAAHRRCNLMRTSHIERPNRRGKSNAWYRRHALGLQPAADTTRFGGGG